jgi:hypothetical protein
MTNPRTLLLSIAATACGFIFTLASLAGPAPTAPSPSIGQAMGQGLASAQAQDAEHVRPVTFAVARSPAVSGFNAVPNVADHDDDPDPLQGRARRS